MIAVFSDIHGNLPALEACHADALARGCTQFLNLGDILSGPLWPRETADWLLHREWPTISGNHDRRGNERILPEHLPEAQLFPLQLGNRRKRRCMKHMPMPRQGKRLMLTHERTLNLQLAGVPCVVCVQEGDKSSAGQFPSRVPC